LAEYENLPLFRRLSRRLRENVESLHQYLERWRVSAPSWGELDVAKARIDELVPEASVPKDMRPEFDELKEEIVRLGGTKKIRIAAAEEDTNRQAFIQNRRLVVTTASRGTERSPVQSRPLDVLIADEAPGSVARLSAPPGSSTSGS
jgi:hypothetical protein